MERRSPRGATCPDQESISANWANDAYSQGLRSKLLRPGWSSEACRHQSKCKDLPPPHSITSSATTSSLSGYREPKRFGRRIASSSLVDRSIGKSVGFTPLSRRPVCRPARRYASRMLFP